MSLYHDSKSGNWYANIQISGGTRIRRSTGTADRHQAQKIHDQWKAEAWSHRPGAGKTWQQAAAAWLTAAPRGESDRYMLRAYTHALGNIALADLTTDLLTTPLHAHRPGTWNRYRNLVRAILRHAHGLGWIDDPPSIPSRKPPPGRLRWLTRDEWARLLAELPPHLIPLARFAVATGLRQANLLAMEWSQVDLARRVMWIHADQAKARKSIGLPLSTDAVDVLRGQIGQHERYVFPYRRRRLGQTIVGPMREIGAAYTRAVQRAGLGPDVNWHTLRHTWASWHVMAGTPLEVLQRLGGWASLQMVLRYAHLSPEYLAGWADNAGSDRSSDGVRRSDTVSDGSGQQKGHPKAA